MRNQFADPNTRHRLVSRWANFNLAFAAISLSFVLTIGLVPPPWQIDQTNVAVESFGALEIPVPPGHPTGLLFGADGSETNPNPVVSGHAPPVQDGAGGDECWGCARARKWPCGEYKKCVETEEGSSKCKQTLPHKNQPCGTCDDSGPLCDEEPPTFVEFQATLAAFTNDRMLPANGRHYIGVQGDQLVLRRKCNGTVVARLQVEDSGRPSTLPVLAGG